MIAELRKRPHFGTRDLTLSHATGEFNYIPDEFVPHTVVLSRPKFEEFVFDFEYSINETIGRTLKWNDGTKFELGKYSGKVLKIVIQCDGSQKLFSKMVDASHKLKELVESLPQESFKRNHELVNQAFRTIGEEIRLNPSQVPSY